MLMSNEFLRAEHSYRGKKLRDQYQSKMGKAGKAAVAVVLASALFAACGTVVAPSALPVVDRQANVVTDNGPSWGPDVAVLEEYLGQ